jgi:hypothetical protein
MKKSFSLLINLQIKGENDFKKFFSYNREDELEGKWDIKEKFDFGGIEIHSDQIFFQTKAKNKKIFSIY